MTLEELKTEANKLGYSLCKHIIYEKVSTRYASISSMKKYLLANAVVVELPAT